MKIAIPTNNRKGLDDKVAEHFGRCSTYTFLNEKGEVTEIIDNISQHAAGSVLSPELIKKHGADILLCSDLGPRALNLCKELGIEVYVCQIEKVRDVFNAWKNNEIKKANMEDVCQDHKL